MESIFLFIGMFGFTAFFIASIFDFFIASPGYKGPVSDHFDGKEFYSIGKGKKVKENVPSKGIFTFLSWAFSRPKSIWMYRGNKFRHIPERRINNKRIFITFINHSTVLIQTDGLNILTDPIWSERASPFIFAGPKRFRAPGVRLQDLPRIDVILLSHNHYDHMDIVTLRELYLRDKPKIYAPLGNSHYLGLKGVLGAKDMDWWDKESLSSEIKLVAVPAQHFSARAISDRNKSLWCGFVLETSRGDIYIAGDTAYGKFIEKIKEKYSKFILGFIPIGAFRPEWLMSPVHISPDDAFLVHKELNIETSVAIHFGTFKLSDDGQDESPNRIRDLVKASGSKAVDFRVLENGQMIML